MGRVIRIFDGRAGAPTRDDRFIPLIDQIRAWGALNQPFLVPQRYTRTRDEAQAVKRLLYLSARYYCSCGARHCNRKYPNVPHDANPAGGCPDGGQRISCRADVVKDSGGHVRVQFSFYDKRESIRAMVAKYGPDPAQWPYNARAKKLKER